MDFNLEIRKKQLQSLKQYVSSSNENLQAVFRSLGWTMPKTLEKGAEAMSCPINKHHLIFCQTSAQHLEKCKLRSAGYQGNELLLSEPTTQTDCNIKLSNAKKIEILTVAKANKSEFKTAWNGKGEDPLTASRLISTFSVDERLAFYDYSVKHTKGPPKPDEFTLDVTNSKEKKELSEKEKLILERDAKRKRAKYKSVHTSKKSQTEITRELIDNQMTLYKDWIKQKQEQERKEKERLKRLAKEKMKKSSDTNTVYDGSQTAYLENGIDSQNLTHWNQLGTYNNGQYYGSLPTGQGVITDWSHVYQSGINSDFYINSDYVEPGHSVESSHLTTTNQRPTSDEWCATENNFHLKDVSTDHYRADNTKRRDREKIEVGSSKKHHSREKRRH